MGKANNKTVLITGATSDIGSEIALRFAKEGWNVICHHLSEMPRAEKIKKEIEKYGKRCLLIKTDLSKPAQVSLLVKRLKKIRIDSLINNAGTCVVSKHFSRLRIGEISETFMVNAFAPMLLSSHLFVDMKKRHFGRIVNISSIAAKYGGSSHSMHYGCSKRALEGLTKTLAREGAEYNVLVNAIRPGVIDTEFHKKFPKDMKRRIDLIPMKKMGKTGDIADMAYYLGSDKNNFITNETIAIAGGE